ncbi:MAG: hypothetical protein AAF399_28450, partial [Bacteroidota bacterium]
IRSIDAQRPIMLTFVPDSSLDQLVGLHLAAAPEIDLIGINAFYPKAFQQAKEELDAIGTSRPLLLSEFGPIGYWDASQSPRERNGTLAEPTDFDKVQAYQSWWTTIDTARQNWLGGAAYNWQSIHSGTSTWFGLTDQAGRLKPAYYGLAESWLGQKVDFPLAEIYVSPSDPLWYRRSRLQLSVISPLLQQDSYEVEWYLKAESRGLSKSFRKVGEGPSVSFSAPAFSSRLYVFLSDDQGNVTTASRVINP